MGSRRSHCLRRSRTFGPASERNEIDLVPNFTRTDVRIIWQSANERFSVHLFAENLEGRFQFASTLVGPEITGGLPVGLVIPLTPRKYGVQLEWKWAAN